MFGDLLPRVALRLPWATFFRPFQGLEWNRLLLRDTRFQILDAG